jgi:hypothetical protein
LETTEGNVLSEQRDFSAIFNKVCLGGPEGKPSRLVYAPMVAKISSFTTLHTPHREWLLFH